jgi:hypothetical protein
MRSISIDGLAKLAQRYGGEPITIVEVDWYPGVTPRFYADRDVVGIPGRIIDVGDLDNVINIFNASSQSLDVTLDDTDGSIKTIMDHQDIHKRTVRVWQYFDGLALMDKFLLFAGKISTPISWSERDRTIKFTILSQIEDKEVGFSAEEGQFPYLPADLVGKAWPMVFGKVLDVPALQVNHAVSGTTLAGVGCLAGVACHLSQPVFSNGSDGDVGLAITCAQISMQCSTLWCAMERCADDESNYLDQINALEKQRGEAIAASNAQRVCAQLRRQEQVNTAEAQGLGANPLPILGGEDFPQGQIMTIDINGCQLTGIFSGSNFHIQSRLWPDGETKATADADNRADPCPYTMTGNKPIHFDYRIGAPCNCRTHGWILSTNNPTGVEMTDAAIIRQFWADSGASVKIYSAEPVTYIVSITPGLGGDHGVFAVKAYKQFIGESRLVDVPSDMYRVEVRQYGDITAVQIVVTKALSSIADQGWRDDLYVTFQSSIGPNTVDILKYLIERYTDLTWDAASFTSVRVKLDAFPANFPLLDRRNTIQVLQEIAYQARCALWIADGVFYIKYLPEEPAAVPEALGGTITVSDIDAENSIDVSLTPTEDLVTKMVITWRMSWAPGATDREKDKSEKRMILRHNISRYGTHEEEYDWYIYNQPDIILKCATFWLIRKSHTWKKLTFKTFLHKLNLETFDCVTFDDGARQYVSTSPVKAIVEKANYNSADNLMSFECLVPIRAGTMDKFALYWPSLLAVDHTWPPQEDIDTGDAGGGGIGMGATGNLPIGYTDGIGTGGTVFVGGPNVVFRPHSDWGEETPTDVNFQAQQVINTAVFAELRASPRPDLDLRLKLARPSDVVYLLPLASDVTLDLAKTKIVDSREDRTDYRYLKDVLRIGETKLCVKTATTFSDGTEEVEFDFKYDEEGKKFGAGTAFLKD